VRLIFNSPLTLLVRRPLLPLSSASPLKIPQGRLVRLLASPPRFKSLAVPSGSGTFLPFPPYSPVHLFPGHFQRFALLLLLCFSPPLSSTPLFSRLPDLPLLCPAFQPHPPFAAGRLLYCYLARHKYSTISPIAVSPPHLVASSLSQILGISLSFGSRNGNLPPYSFLALCTKHFFPRYSNSQPAENGISQINCLTHQVFFLFFPFG